MQLEFAETAQKDLKKLNQVTQKQIIKKLAFYLGQSDPLQFAVKLHDFSRGGNYRFRVGRYRIVFDVADKTIYVLHIEHRREIYRRR